MIHRSSETTLSIYTLSCRKRYSKVTSIDVGRRPSGKSPKIRTAPIPGIGITISPEIWICLIISGNNTTSDYPHITIFDTGCCRSFSFYLDKNTINSSPGRDSKSKTCRYNIVTCDIVIKRCGSITII
jgi:hypothetical protein